MIVEYDVVCFGRIGICLVVYENDYFFIRANVMV